MGWIERRQNAGGDSKCEDLVARRIAKGLGFSAANNSLPWVEKALGVKVDYDAPLIDHIALILLRVSSASAGVNDFGEPRIEWRIKVLHNEISNKTYEDNKEKWLNYSGKNLIVMGRKAGTNEGIAYVVVNEDDIPECVKLPKCTLVDRDKGKMVFLKEIENLVRDLVVTEKWSLDLDEQ